jgi:uncharacterized membrane protein YagU involved in acid resistance
MTARNIGMGALAGLAGGVVFGMMMHAMGMIGMIAGLIGAEGAAAGWAVHLVNSAIIGAIFGALAARLRGWGAGAGAGAAYGIVWWVLGALLIMPLWMGMPPFQLDETAMFSLVGHLMYGVVTGVAFVALARQTEAETAAASSRA